MGVYIKGMTKIALRTIFDANRIPYDADSLIEISSPHGMLIDENDVLRFFNTHDESLAVIEAEDE